MQTTFTPNCVSGPSLRSASPEPVHAAELRSLFTSTQSALLATDDTAVTIIQSGNEVDRIVAKVAVDDLPVKIALLNPNSKKNEVICDALHLDTTLAHVILSHEIHGQQFNTALSFDPQVNLFTPAESASFYATLLDNHWIAAPDVELDATQWATRVLSALKESTARETKAEEDFSSVEFRASRKIEA